MGAEYDKKVCHKCGSLDIIKWGKHKGKQCYKCKTCGTVFILQQKWGDKAYEEYCLKGYSYEDISFKYGKTIRTVQRSFDKLRSAKLCPVLEDKCVNVCLDGVYFGWSISFIVIRANGQNIYFEQTSETVEHIAQCLRKAEVLGYRYKSFTIDGRKGVVQMLQERYPGIPIQYCQFHQKKTVRSYLTREPKTECGKALLAFLRPLTHYSRQEFEQGLQSLEQQYKEFLAERNEQGRYMHRSVRSAFRSLRRNLPYLFTYKAEQYKHLNIPNTTNTCEGYFSQLKSKVRVHSGLIRERRIKLINKLLSKPHI